MPDTLTITERAILSNQYKILSFLDKSDLSHAINAEIFENGYSGLYGEALQNIHAEEVSREVCTETHDILTMFRMIPNAISTLTPAETAALNLHQIQFDGFDANNDPHYYFTRFMIERQNKYQDYSADDLNSHSMASLIRYRRMLPVYRNIIANHVNNWGAAELQQLIAAV